MAATEINEDAARRNYKAPYSKNHPIPTIQKYREHRDQLKEEQAGVEAAQQGEEDESRTKRAIGAVKHIAKNEDKKDLPGDPYPTANRNAEDARGDHGQEASVPLVPHNDNGFQGDDEEDQGQSTKKGKKEGDNLTASEKVSQESDPKQKRKNMKHSKRDDGGREVTDPVTHLPVVIRDSTNKDLHRAPENEQAPGSIKKTATGFKGATKSKDELKEETAQNQEGYDGMQLVFPPPAFSSTKAKMVKTYQIAFAAGLGAIVLVFTSTIFIFVGLADSRISPWPRKHDDSDSWRVFFPLAGAIAFALLGAGAIIFLVVGWLSAKMKSIWEDEVWDAARAKEVDVNNKADSLPESVAWLNSVLSSVWPLINPDLFSGVVDMIEDVMQASLPRVIRMVSVDDIGQGSEAIRVLGIRWLPTGAAAQNVSEDGQLSKPDLSNDRKAPGKGQTEAVEHESNEDSNDNDDHDDHDEDGKADDQKKQDEQQQQALKEGLEAEQGDFVNMELAFVYRARSSGRSLQSKVKNAHLYLKFYLPGGIFVPVWVELRGIIGTARVRLQLTPDPPFFSLCTLTFLGQPRVDLSCTPLSKKLPNLMNVPLISSFVQSAIDAALAEYVAPRSLTLDLKDMLVGDDFKKDTVARGVIVIFLEEANDFKEGDGGVGPLKGSSDSYLTCSWGKFGKTLVSTRVIEDDQHPKFHEWAYMLVSPQEIDAGEKLRIQLWDSDRFTADDDLGRVEVTLHDLMHNDTKNQMTDREDRFTSKNLKEHMPGTLKWSVGYYSKLGITEHQLKTQTSDSRIRTKEEMKRHISELSQKKLREATARDESREIEQQKEQDFKEREDAFICASAPDDEHRSGVLSIQIHNITGLATEKLNKDGKETADDKEDEEEEGHDLPSAYCTIILNHRKIYKTRTKPKNAKPFFNAGTERFIRDWKTAEVMISVRDAREREADALLGIIYLPLAKMFKDRSQMVDTFPLMGGMGYGRARVSVVFRSFEVKLPKELIGWDLGTLEIKGGISTQGLPEEIRSHRLKLRSNVSRIKMVADNNEWQLKKGKKNDFLAFRKRYSSALVLEVRKSKLGQDSTPAFAVLWLKDIPDEEEITKTLKVWTGGKDELKKATTCAGYDGDSCGEIQVTMKFWRGLSGYHKNYAQKSKNEDMKNVMEVLDTVNDEETSDTLYDSDSSDSDSDSDSETGERLKVHTNQDSSGDEAHGVINKTKKRVSDFLGENDSEDGERGARGQVRDYKENHKQMHRQHRGIMQWKAMRSADWVADKVRHKKNQVTSVFHHSEKGPGIETEV